MEIKEVAQKLCDAYNTSRPIYGNKAEIFGNTTPIKADYEKVYKALCWLRENEYNVYAKIEKLVTTDNIIAIYELTGCIKDILPDEYSLEANMLKLSLIAILLCRKNQ